MERVGLKEDFPFRSAKSYQSPNINLLVSGHSLGKGGAHGICTVAVLMHKI